MRALCIIAVLLSLSFQTSAVEPNADTRLGESARVLDWRAHQSLGIGIQHIALLLQAGPGEFFRKETLVQNGFWARLKELESKGFITVSESSMPGGNPLGDSAVSFSATAKGQAIISALKGK